MNQPQQTREQISVAYRQMIASVIEETCVKRIEQIEGRVPSNDELKAHGIMHICDTNGTVQYLWRGQPICQYEPAGYSPGGWHDAIIMELGYAAIVTED